MSRFSTRKPPNIIEVGEVVWAYSNVFYVNHHHITPRNKSSYTEMVRIHHSKVTEQQVREAGIDPQLLLSSTQYSLAVHAVPIRPSVQMDLNNSSPKL